MNDFSNGYAVVLAGGSGSRFWPKSRQQLPKQLCNINSDDFTLIEQTFMRLEEIIPVERRIIVTHYDQVEKTRAVVGDKAAIILAEPERKNTAAALASAALFVRQLAHESGIEHPIMYSFHADHLIEKPDAYIHALQAAKVHAEHGSLVLLGIEPTYPSTGYGYVHCGEDQLTGVQGKKVKSFKEKPDRKLALEYLESGKYLWNSGIFVWSVKTLLQELARYLPRTVARLESASRKWDFHSKVLNMAIEDYAVLEDISIDHALLEKSDQVVVIPSRFSWLDLGSWESVDMCRPADDDSGNRLSGDILTLDCQSNIISTDSFVVATIGLQDFVVVVDQGAVLVCPKNRSQDVKKIVALLKEQKRLELL